MRALMPIAVLVGSIVGCSAAAPTSPAAATPPAPRAAAPTPAGGTCGQPNFQARVLARVNAVRARGANCGSAGRFGAAPPLAWSDALARAAEMHSRDMVTGNFFSHTGSTGLELRQRAEAVGYEWRTLAENIAGGRETVDGVVEQWLASPGHCANLLKPDLLDVGVACVRAGPRNTYTHYWTMALGTPAPQR